MSDALAVVEQIIQKRPRQAPYRVWKQPADGGVPYPLLREIEYLRGVAPDCALCSVMKGIPVLVDRVEWHLRGGAYVVTVYCHGQREVKSIKRADVENSNRVVVVPAFQAEAARQKARSVSLAKAPQLLPVQVPVLLVKVLLLAQREMRRVQP